MEILWAILIIAVAMFAVPFFMYLFAIAFFGEAWMKELLGWEDPNKKNRTENKEEKK